MNNEKRLRSCGYCEFLSCSVSMEPCKTCLCCDDYHPYFQPQKHSRKEMNKVGIGCYSCKYEDVDIDKEPCNDCFRCGDHSMYEAVQGENTKNTTLRGTKRTAILTEANSIVSGNRKAGEYGQPEDSFGVIAGLWSEYLDQKIKPHDVAVMMALLKIARIKGGKYKLDNWIDLAGYAACGGECQGREEGEWY